MDSSTHGDSAPTRKSASASLKAANWLSTWLSIDKQAASVLTGPATIKTSMSFGLVCSDDHLDVPESLFRSDRQWQSLYFLPLPHQQGSLRPGRFDVLAGCDETALAWPLPAWNESCRLRGRANGVVAARARPCATLACGTRKRDRTI